MKTYIRLDMKGHWRGTEHKSSLNGLAGEWDIETGRDSWEKGISCYELNADGIANLYNYWINIASLDEKDAANMQVTIFEGEEVGIGADWEVLAECHETVKELEAIELFKLWKKVEEQYYNDDETDAYDVREYMEENAVEILEWLNQ